MVRLKPAELNHSKHCQVKGQRSKLQRLFKRTLPVLRSGIGRACTETLTVLFLSMSIISVDFGRNLAVRLFFEHFIDSLAVHISSASFCLQHAACLEERRGQAVLGSTFTRACILCFDGTRRAAWCSARYGMVGTRGSVGPEQTSAQT